MITNVHTGGASLSLANSILGEHLVAMQPDVSFHVNGGPIAMPDEDFELVIDETKPRCRSSRRATSARPCSRSNSAIKKDCFDRFLIGTDTPTGTGVMPQGMIKTITEMSCLTDHPPEWLIAAATGNNAKVYRLNSGFLAPGKDADILLIDAALGGSQTNRPRGDQERRRDLQCRLLHGRRTSLHRAQPLHAAAKRYARSSRTRSRTNSPPRRCFRVVSQVNR